jgi:HD-like signal output (HDOD) protein
MNALAQIISNVNSLPTLPMVYSNLVDAMKDPDIGHDKLSKIISMDQASAFRILRVANSPFYGLHGRIDTISQALLYLGYDEIKNIVLSLSVIKHFPKEKKNDLLRPIDLWAHSIGAGMATRILGQTIGEKNVENYFLAGILHDIGKVVFLNFAPNEYFQVLEIIKEKNCSISDAEVDVFGADHAYVGKLLAEKWKVPQTICDAIYYHHSGQLAAETNSMIACVHLGDIIARALEFGYAGDPFIPEPSAKIWDALNLPDGFFTSSQIKLKIDFEHTLKIMLVE